jgi:hypothetical protein
MCAKPTPHMGFLADFRGQMSWGRFCSAVSLAVAVVQEFRGKSIADIALFLSIATGTYTASKITEMVTHRTTIQQGGNDAQS